MARDRSCLIFRCNLHIMQNVFPAMKLITVRLDTLHLIFQILEGLLVCHCLRDTTSFISNIYIVHHSISSHVCRGAADMYQIQADR